MTTLKALFAHPAFVVYLLAKHDIGPLVLAIRRLVSDMLLRQDRFIASLAEAWRQAEAQQRDINLIMFAARYTANITYSTSTKDQDHIRDAYLSLLKDGLLDSFLFDNDDRMVRAMKELALVELQRAYQRLVVQERTQAVFA